MISQEVLRWLEDNMYSITKIRQVDGSKTFRIAWDNGSAVRQVEGRSIQEAVERAKEVR